MSAGQGGVVLPQPGQEITLGAVGLLPIRHARPGCRLALPLALASGDGWTAHRSGLQQIGRLHFHPAVPQARETEASGSSTFSSVRRTRPAVQRKAAAFERAFAGLRRGWTDWCVALLPESDGPMHHALGRTRVIAEPRTLDDVNDAIDEVLHARTNARLVFEL